MLLRTFISVLLALHGVQAASAHPAGSTLTPAAQDATPLAGDATSLTSAQRDLLAVPPKKKPAKKKPIKRRPPPPKKKPPTKKPVPAPSPQFVLPSPPPPKAIPAPTPVPPAPFPCTLNLNGAAINFQTCFETRSYTDPIGGAFYSLEGSTLKIGFRAASAEAQWVAWAYLPRGGMIMGNAVFAQLEGSSVVPASYQMNGYSSAVFGPTTVQYSAVQVGRDGDMLAGVAQMAWPEGETEITVSMAWGSMGAGKPQVHRFIPRVYELNKKTLRHGIPPEL